MRRSSGLVIALLTATVLAACGQKGPLVLPDGAEAGTLPAGAEDATEQATRDEEEDN